MGNHIGLRTDRLRALREKFGWSQRELARMCGLSDSIVRKYEAGANDPTGFTLKSLAEKLGVSTDYLLGITDDPQVQVREPLLSEDERIMLETFRREGWAGVIHLGAERLSK